MFKMRTAVTAVLLATAPGISAQPAPGPAGTQTPSNSMSVRISRTMIGAVGNNRRDSL